MHQAEHEVMHLVTIARRCLNWQLPIRREFDMRGYDSKATLGRMACVLALVAGSVSAALAQPATLRLGYGTAAEEPLWLVVAKPDLARNQGKAYTLDATRFTGSDKRGQAFEAGAIDLAASSANGVIFAAAEGVSARVIASISRESSRGFSTSFYVKDSSPIKSIADLKGKIVGINGFYTSGHLWLKSALEKQGGPRPTSRSRRCRSRRCRKRSMPGRSISGSSRSHSRRWRKSR
jgi:ABC-type taurine transport system substrate-binding protein